MAAEIPPAVEDGIDTCTLHAQNILFGKRWFESNLLTVGFFITKVACRLTVPYIVICVELDALMAAPCSASCARSFF